MATKLRRKNIPTPPATRLLLIRHGEVEVRYQGIFGGSIDMNLSPRGQRQAATALGLTTAQAYRYVLLPMAFRIIMPPLTSEFLSTIKNTSVAITIGLIELTAQARAMQEFSFQVFEAFTAATVLYLLVNIVVVTAMRFLERSLAVPGYITGK